MHLVVTIFWSGICLDWHFCSWLPFGQVSASTEILVRDYLLVRHLHRLTLLAVTTFWYDICLGWHFSKYNNECIKLLRLNITFLKFCIDQCFVFCVTFHRSLYVLCPFSSDHCIVCTSLKYGFWLHLWYLEMFFCKTDNGRYFSVCTLPSDLPRLYLLTDTHLLL